MKAGEELARIDTTDIDLALRQAQAERRQAAAELALRETGARKEDIAEAEAQVRTTEADLRGAQLDLDLDRMQGLLDRGSGTTKVRDDARTPRDVVTSRLSAEREALGRPRAGFRVEEKDGARARLAVADARIAVLEQQRKDATVRSPADGVVTERIAEPGELLQVGAPVCVISRLADAWLTAYIPAPDLWRMDVADVEPLSPVARGPC